MSIAAVRAVLVVDAAVLALVPEGRIEALRRTQSFEIPAITLSDSSLAPFNHLRGYAGLDSHQVQVDAYGANYTQALAIALAARTALAAAGFLLQNQIERNEPDTDPELFQITQTWSVFT